MPTTNFTNSTTKAGSNVQVVNLDDSPDKVRQKMREFWNNKQIQEKGASSQCTNNNKCDDNNSAKQTPNSSTRFESHINMQNDCMGIVSNERDNQENTTKCPVCDKNVIESSINAHLDACLASYEADDKKGKDVTLSENTRRRKNPFVDDDYDAEEIDTCSGSETSKKRERSYPCPICKKEVLAAEMTYHVDMCIDN